MPSSSNNKDTQPDYDPYEVLGIPMDASSAAIAKAFRKASVKYHPDKQSAVSNETQRAHLAAQFQQLQDARDFLQDPTKRQKYDAQRASLLARQAADRAREQHMTAQRKRLREQLAQQEAHAARAKKQQRQQSSSSQKSTTRVDALRTQGQQLREQYAARQEAEAWREAHKTAEAQAQQRRQQQQSSNDDTTTSNIEDRQVRLKWSRKKLSISPSEDSLAHLLQPLFGPVERVELLGTKGNLALVTFAARESCTPCVKYYQTSDEMRATYVGARKETEARKQQSQAEAKKQQKEAPQSPSARATKTSMMNDHESVDAYKLRRAAEREALLRKMELEEEAATTSVEQTTTNTTSQSTKSSSSSKKANTTADTTTFPTPTLPSVFPPDFPHTAEYAACQSPYEKLLVAESQILTKILSSAGSTDG